MSPLSEWREKMGRVKVTQWAALLLALGLAGSLLFSGSWGAGVLTEQPQDSGAQGDALETRLAAVLSRMEGAGQVEVVIHYAQTVSTSAWPQESAQETGEPVGVVVVAEGADNLRVRLELAQAVQTLLRLEAESVEVFAMDSRDGAR
ncbi:MAG: hypothetical protein UFE80_00320 [Christensenellales bacterium]|uniref:Stage III sporulation protein AG n=1 Tax=Candidatus Avichristensenella intestinipullorum TaxID=2840693 RepID=A0A9D1CHV6_9FIRM|nr:hypothetical protein [Christensenellales bacterium]HIQ61987.1 hypothetical protein [Candidatus Avichristensenella intestinipullorum]